MHTSDIDFPLILIILLFGVCIWIAVIKRRDYRLTAPFDARLNRHGIKVRVARKACQHCHKPHQFILSQYAPMDLQPSEASVFGVPQELDLGYFCASCGAEELRGFEIGRGDKPRQLTSFMERLDAEAKKDV